MRTRLYIVHQQAWKGNFLTMAIRDTKFKRGDVLIREDGTYVVGKRLSRFRIIRFLQVKLWRRKHPSQLPFMNGGLLAQIETKDTFRDGKWTKEDHDQLIKRLNERR